MINPVLIFDRTLRMAVWLRRELDLKNSFRYIPKRSVFETDH